MSRTLSFPVIITLTFPQKESKTKPKRWARQLVNNVQWLAVTEPLLSCLYSRSIVLPIAESHPNSPGTNVKPKFSIVKGKSWSDREPVTTASEP